ncbi:MAG TPA: alpha-galactosidase [Plantibacter sp.]|nr:alpha-galactosidase [Plantibacter sp.]
MLVDGSPLSDGSTAQRHSGSVVVAAEDDETGLTILLEIELTRAGLLRVRASLTNTGDTALDILGVTPALDVPDSAREILDFTGRWGSEKLPQRHPVVMGTHLRESRHGRPGLDATTVVALGTPGFDGSSGQVWLGHVGWSGNHEYAVERTDGRLAFRGGELLLPGEVRLGCGEQYRSPWVYGSYGMGLDAAASRFHRFLRERSRASRQPRPVTLNVWEAVMFDQDFDALAELATQAAALGVERYVLDDGWFRGRYDDRRGLGDWTPDPERWPDGLQPLARHVHSLGMEFGLWFEPEMANEDSDLARQHPDWILRARRDLPPRTRHQQVLDLTNPAAFDHVLRAIDTLIVDLDLAYLKWDHNRDLVDAGHPSTGQAAVHDQTLAVYRLLDELRTRHPLLEIESCASAKGASISASWNGRTGCTPRTTTIRSSVLACCGGRDCWCRLRCSARMWPPPGPRPPVGPTRCTRGAQSRSSGISVSNGTSVNSAMPNARHWPAGSPSSGPTGSSSPPAASWAPATPIRMLRCFAASSPRMARPGCSPSCLRLVRPTRAVASAFPGSERTGDTASASRRTAPSAPAG